MARLVTKLVEDVLVFLRTQFIQRAMDHARLALARLVRGYEHGQVAFPGQVRRQVARVVTDA